MCRFYKLLNYEFWPWYFWHILLFPIHIYNVIKCRSLVYFTYLNPSFGKTGGFFGDSKSQILENVPQSIRLKEFVLKDGDLVEAQLEKFGMQFPLVFKPEMGERGMGVAVINSTEEAMKYLNKHSKYEIIIQEFCDFELEYGVFVYKHPDKGWHISGLTGKVPFAIIGDGVSNLETLVNSNCRYAMQLKRLKSEGKFDFNTILEKNETVILEKVLNHRLGTIFINESKQIDKGMVQVFTEICNQIKGFNYGRFDLKTNSLADLKKGNFKVIELNGAAAEPTIIYDQQNTGFFKSLLIMIKHQLAQGVIAKAKKSEIENPLTPLRLIQILKQHFYL